MYCCHLAPFLNCESETQWRMEKHLQCSDSIPGLPFSGGPWNEALVLATALSFIATALLFNDWVEILLH